MKCSFLLPVAATTLALSACGSLDANTGVSPTLATLKGGLLNPDSVYVSGAVRVAVVWRSSTPGMFNVAEDLPVQPVFPASFTIDFNGPPPLAAMTSLSEDDDASASSMPTAMTASGGGGGPPPDAAIGTARAVSLPSVQPLAATVSPGTDVEYAFGSVVAYVDENGNGKLDLLPDDATTYVDLIVATNPDMAIVYLQGSLPGALGVVQLVDSTGHSATDGYNLVLAPVCPAPGPVAPSAMTTLNPACASPPPVPDAGTADPDAGACQGASQIRWLPMSTPFPLTVEAAPEVTDLLCENGGETAGVSATGSGAGPSDPSVQPAQYPDPCDPNLSCSVDGSQYFFQTCTVVSQGICLGTVTSCTAVGYVRPTPVPAGWPCITGG